MTSTVIVEAHPGSGVNRVMIELADSTNPNINETYLIKDGERKELYVCDGRSVTVREVNVT